jgi:hypothetical protein
LRIIISGIKNVERRNDPCEDAIQPSNEEDGACDEEDD